MVVKIVLSFGQKNLPYSCDRKTKQGSIEMNTLDAIMIAEGEKEATFDESIVAWQHLIDTGVVWQLQGVFGRTAKDLIESGLCTL